MNQAEKEQLDVKNSIYKSNLKTVDDLQAYIENQLKTFSILNQKAEENNIEYNENPKIDFVEKIMKFCKEQSETGEAEEDKILDILEKNGIISNEVKNLEDIKYNELDLKTYKDYVTAYKEQSLKNMEIVEKSFQEEYSDGYGKNKTEELSWLDLYKTYRMDEYNLIIEEISKQNLPMNEMTKKIDNAIKLKINDNSIYIYDNEEKKSNPFEYNKESKTYKYNETTNPGEPDCLILGEDKKIYYAAANNFTDFVMEGDQLSIHSFLLK